MNKTDIIRAWKDPAYRAALSPAELAHLPAHPAGLIELSNEQLRGVSAAALTTAMTCTEYTFADRRACCPR